MPRFAACPTKLRPLRLAFSAVAPLLTAAWLTGCAALSTASSLPPPEKTPAPGAWVTLFDGKNMNAWRGYCQPGMPKTGWAIEGNTLHLSDNMGGFCGDLITKAQYGDFVLELEFKTAPGINSGVFYRAKEVRGNEIWQSAFECQILDPAWRDETTGKSIGMLHQSGALYAMYPANPDAIKPAGKWNQLRIAVTRHGHIEHWLNGLRIVSCDIGSPDYSRRLAESKFSDAKTFPTFGKNAFGYIGLQDHGDTDIWFRNIRVMPLDQPSDAPAQ